MQSSFQSLSVMTGWGRTVMAGFGTVSASSAGGRRDSESEAWHWHGAFVASSVLSAPFDTVEVPEFIWSPRALANVQ